MNATIKTSARALVCALPLLCLSACVRPSSSTASTTVNIPAPKPVVTSNGNDVGKQALEIQGETADNAAVNLSKFRGKVVLLDFWATWCGPCRQLIPHEKELTKQYKDRPFTILGISRDRKREDLKNFLAKDKLPWPNIFDGAGDICDQWDIEALPTFVLIDHKGFVVGRWVGGGEMDEIEKAIAKTVNAAEQDQQTRESPDVP